MKNLKKVLALVLVAATLMGLAVSASAKSASDYKDYSSVTYKEAVDVMTAVGVFNGSNGNFNPAGILTREEAAKIVTYMLMGKEQADKLTAIVAPYSDVPATRWSAGAIAYCKNQGILAGVGSNKFDPAGKLTGLQFAKMMLVALGYDATIEKMVGSSWAVNTASKLLDADLDADLTGVALDAQMTREQAAQMALNTFKADMVKYSDKGSSIVINGVEISNGASDAERVDNSKATKETIKSDDWLQFAEKYCTKLVLDDNAKDDFGAPANKWTYDKDTVGKYGTNDAELVYTSGYDEDEWKDVDDDYDYAADLEILVNGQDSGIADAKALAQREYNGTVIEMYATDSTKSDEINLIVLKQAYLAKVTDKDEDTIDLDIYNPWTSASFGTTGESVSYKDDTKKSDDNYDKAAGYDKDEYFLIYTDGATVDGDVIAVADAEKMTGKVTSFKNNDGASYDGYNGVATVDGTKYTLASGYAEQTELKPGDEYDLYLDENGFVIGAETVKEAAADITDVYFVDSIWKETKKVAGADVDSFFAQVVKISDGAISEIELEDIEKAVTAQNTAYAEESQASATKYAGKLVTMSDKKWTDKVTPNAGTHKANDNKMDLELWTSDDYDNIGGVTFSTDFEKTSTRFSVTAPASKTYRVNSSTQYLFIEGANNKVAVTSYTGGAAYKASTNATAAKSITITEDDSAIAKYVIIVTTDADQAQTYSEDAVYVKDNSSEMGDGYRVQTVYDAEGKETTMNVDEGEYDLTAGFYTYDTNDDGYYVLDKANDMTIAAGGFVWDDEEGAITDATIAKDALFENLLTVTKGGNTVSDIDVANAKFVDAHDTKGTGEYDRSISTLARLCDLVDNDRVQNVELQLNVSKDGAVVVILTSVQPAP